MLQILINLFLWQEKLLKGRIDRGLLTESMVQLMVAYWVMDSTSGLTENNVMHVVWDTYSYSDINHGLLTHWGLVTPFGVIDLGQHWLR